MKQIAYVVWVTIVALTATYIIVNPPSGITSVDQAEIHEAFLMCNNAGGVRAISVSAASDAGAPKGHTSRLVVAKCANGMNASKVIYLQILTREAAQPLPPNKV